MQKRIGILFLLGLLAMVVVGCGKDGEAPPSQSNGDSGSQLVEYGVAGNITEITVSEDDNVFGIIKVEGPKDNGAMYDKAMVTITPNTKIYSENLSDFNDLKVGMYVNVFFDGPAKESYPVQATAKQVNIIFSIKQGII